MIGSSGRPERGTSGGGSEVTAEAVELMRKHEELLAEPESALT